MQNALVIIFLFLVGNNFAIASDSNAHDWNEVTMRCPGTMISRESIIAVKTKCPLCKVRRLKSVGEQCSSHRRAWECLTCDKVTFHDPKGKGICPEKIVDSQRLVLEGSGANSPISTIINKKE